MIPTEIENESEARRRVARGAAFLDEHVPGWYASVDLDNLIMNDPNSCVIGQVFDAPVDSPYSSYSVGCEELGISTGDDDRAMGFECSSMNDDYTVSYAVLEREWSEAILSRLAQNAYHTPDNGPFAGLGG